MKFYLLENLEVVLEKNTKELLEIIEKIKDPGIHDELMVKISETQERLIEEMESIERYLR